MPNKIPEVEIENFLGFVSAIEGARGTLGSDSLWFRGVSKTSHTLVPGIFRNPAIKTIDEVTTLEKSIYQEFSFRSPSYDGGVRDQWDLLFLMQHYRAPTRLLDWTSSPLIALFFAVSRATDPKEDAVIWIMEPARWNSGVLHDISQVAEVFSTSDEILETYHPMSKSKSRRSPPLAVEGIINNPRINAQKGKFVIFGHQLKSMSQAAEECPVWGENMPLMKIRCKANSLPTLANDLYYYGITQTSVYPDLEGLAVELKLKNGFSHV